MGRPKVSLDGRLCADCSVEYSIANWPKQGGRLCSSCRYKRGVNATRKWREENPERVRELAARSQGRRWIELREAAIARLGGKCAECQWSIPEALVLDHIGGGGTEERQGLNRLTFYRQVAEGERSDIQLLCLNHNRLKTGAEISYRRSIESLTSAAPVHA